jgi:hypothetical protein
LTPIKGAAPVIVTISASAKPRSLAMTRPHTPGPRPTAAVDNHRIAAALRDCATLLTEQGEDGYRVRAYQRAADRIDMLDLPLRQIAAEGGQPALIALPTIGQGIASAIAEMLETGRWQQLDRLRGAAAPEDLFATLPGIGPALAGRIADALDVDTLEGLEDALQRDVPGIPGIGPRRREALLAVIAERLARLRPALPAKPEAPPVALLLDADATYRRMAEAGELPRIAPRRRNPKVAAWLPVLHARRDDWHLTVLHSNSALAHRRGRTRDWVVVYVHRGDAPETRWTVVTEWHGALCDKRVVRGREAECADHYASDCPPDARSLR